MLLVLVGAIAYGGGIALGVITIPSQLGDVYCYNNGVVLEHACRKFDSVGFVTQASPYVGSVSGSPKVLSWALVYTAEARGALMAFCGIVAGFASGYLIRSET
jgi:hypothetical protein